MPKISNRPYSTILSLGNMRVALLSIVTLGLLTIHLLNCTLALYYQYAPTSSDEIDYVKSIEYYVANGRPHAFSTFDEIFSPNGNYSFRGPAYQILFGLPQLISGVHSQSFILYANILLSIALLALASGIQRDAESRLLVAAIILSSGVFVMYTTSYMMEILQIFISVIAAWLLPTLMARPVLGLAVPLILGFTRQSNFLYSAPVFVRKMTLARFALIVGVWVAMAGVLLLEMRYLHAPYPGGKLGELMLTIERLDLAGAIGELLYNIREGVVRFLTQSEDGYFYLVARYVFLAATLCSVVLGLSKSRPIPLAAGLAGLAFFASLLALYDVGAWRDLRSLAGVTVFLIAILGRNAGKPFLFAILTAQLAVYPSLIAYRKDFNEQRVMPFLDRLEAGGDRIAAFQTLDTLPGTQAGRSMILLEIEKGLMMTDMGVEYLNLPVRTIDGAAMRYSFERDGVAGPKMADYRLTASSCNGSPPILTTAHFNACRPAAIR